ncbi:TrkH family potassium uptake protein [Peptoniphilus sp.]|jgi:trk system potassium uptake protein TrkH|uniref:TrkH family potassium uptake protein n=1 Tax=Peptoniphilus sp. TaxID=1971214 RepID=UPI003D91BE18
MNHKLISKIIGLILIIEVVFMVPSLILGLTAGDGSAKGFAIAILVSLIIGLLLISIKYDKKFLSPTDGIAIVTLSWLVVSIVGALPLFISGDMSYVDSFFEIVSGFTTTGASVIVEIEKFPKSIILWRSTTHWIGGMGILVFTVGLLPKLGVGGFQIYKAESPGPVSGKIESRISQSSQRLYIIYIVITIALFICLKAAGMSSFDSVVHTFGVVGTGGFSSKNNSFMSYTGYAIPIIMSVFMFMCATNFSVYALLTKKKFKEIFMSSEIKLWFGFIASAIILIALDLYRSGYSSLPEAFRDSAFQVTSISSTSGFASADYDLWPSFSKFVLVICMIFGGCAGSTGGGVKIVRIAVLLKLISREMKKVTHPRAVLPIRSSGKNVDEEIVLGITAYLGTYFIITLISTLIVTFSGTDIMTSFSSVITTLSNVGPGFAEVGPTKNFAFYNDFYKIYFSILMLLGRLEFFTIMGLFSLSNRKKGAFN